MDYRIVTTITIAIFVCASTQLTGATDGTVDNSNKVNASSLDECPRWPYDPATHLCAVTIATKIMQSVEDVYSMRFPFPTRCQECFKGLGCFDACNGTFSYIHMLPESPAQIKTKFRLYPWYDNTTFTEVNYTNVKGLDKKVFENQNRGLFIVTHGFASDSSSQWMVDLKNLIIEHVSKISSSPFVFELFMHSIPTIRI